LSGGVPQPAHAAKTKANAEESVEALKTLKTAYALLDKADELTAAKKWTEVKALMDEDVFKNCEQNLLKLVKFFINVIILVLQTCTTAHQSTSTRTHT
jgi:hypothetical protein